MPLTNEQLNKLQELLSKREGAAAAIRMNMARQKECLEAADRYRAAEGQARREMGAWAQKVDDLLYGAK